MNRTLICAAAVTAVCAVAGFAVSQQPAPEPLNDTLLHVGETIGLEDPGQGDRYRLTINPTWRTRNIHTVIEVHEHFVVLEDQSKQVQLRIPLWSIKSVEVQATGVRSRP